MIVSVFSTMLQVMIPLSIPVTVGALLGKYKQLDTKPLAVLYMYVLSPAILLDTLNRADISSADVTKTVAFSILNLLMLWVVARLIGRLLRLPAAEEAGLTLVSTFTNSANYGLPLILLAFGEAGLDKASVYVITQIIIVNTIGVYYAARSQFSVRSAIRSVFALPSIYAAILALFLHVFDLHFHAGIEKGIALVAGAYSPVVLMILGAQMVKVKGASTEQPVRNGFWLGMTVRLLLAPLLACLALSILHIDGTLYAVLFILSAMPVAVNAVVLSERFQASPQLVSKCIVWTTVASFFVLPVLIAIVR
ncbi:MAG: AEC family transporter [Clostridia bacterium]